MRGLRITGRGVWRVYARGKCMYMGTSGCVPQRQLVGKLKSHLHTKKSLDDIKNEHPGSGRATAMRNPEVSQSSRKSCRSGKVTPPENRNWDEKGLVFSL